MKLIIFIFYLTTFTLVTSDRRGPAKLTRRSCPEPEDIPNGSQRIRKNGRLLRVSCRFGYSIQGPRVIDCVNGKWLSQKPVCAKAGCSLDEPHPEHGVIQYENGMRMILFCLDNYKLAGNRFAYCNGTNWDRPIGNCREPNFLVEHECDFETDDICGWVYEEGTGTQWRRVTAMNIYTHYQTGPRHDHTFSSLTGGHYMLMETIDSNSEPGYLLSPIYERELSLKTACCFRFFYFMYGPGVGELNIYVRPISIEVKDMLLKKEEYLKFHKSGNQNNLWNEAHFSISELEEDFQIVIVTTAGKNHLSDIAIDDVKLMIGDDCTALDEDNSASVEDEVTEEVIFDTQSCANRCFDDTGAGFVRRNRMIYGYCDCNLDCEDEDNCCPDFRERCLDIYYAQSTQISEEEEKEIRENSFEVTPTTMPEIKTAKSTTTSTSTSTTTTTTTTTPKPTTTTTTTPKPTTTTTPKPITTTPRTTSTSTTTAKPIIKPIIPSTKSTTTTTTTTSTTTTTRKPIITATTAKLTTSTFTPPKPRIPNPNLTNKTEPLEKQNIATWEVNGVNSSRNRDNNTPNISRIMLSIFIIIVSIIIVISLIYRFKDRMVNWISGTDKGGDVETSSIRTKYIFKTKYGQRNASRQGDMDDLLEDDAYLENEANFGVDNKLTVTKPPIKTNPENSLSTNL